VKGFAATTLTARMATALYRQSGEAHDGEEIEKLNNLELHYFYYLNWCALCCCKKERYKKYAEAFEKVDLDIAQSMNYIRFFRIRRVTIYLLNALLEPIAAKMVQENTQQRKVDSI